MSDDPTLPPPSMPDTATIVQTMQQLTDIEGDLADTAVAVALAPTTSEAAPDANAEAAGEQPNPVIQNAEAMETVLKQSIPDAPAAAAVQEQAQAVSEPTAAPPTSPQEVSAALTDAPPPISVPAPLEAAGNDDEIVIDDDSSSTIQPDEPSDPAVTVAPAEVESAPVPAAVLSNSTAEPTVNGHVSPESAPAPAPAPASIPSVPVPHPAAAPIAEVIEPTIPVGPLPDGLSPSSPSVASNLEIIRDWRRHPTNPQIILALFHWSIQRSEILDARAWYAVLAKDNPTASSPLLDLINLESSLTNFAAVETLFARALKGPSGGITASADVNIWKAYLHYIRRQNPTGTGAPDEEVKRGVITDAYEFALKQCGVDRESGEIWGEYIAFVQDAKAKNTWETQAQQDTLRKIYQRAICIPLNNVEALWKGYDAFESSVNKQTSKKFLAERSPAYMTARTALRELRSLTDPLPHPVIPPAPSFSDADRQLIAGWKAYLKWEEGNPLVIADAEVLADRVGYAMRRCLAEMRHFPEMWHHAAHHYLKESKVDEAAEVLRAGVEACPKSILLTFATAEIEEDRKNLAAAHTLFSNLLDYLSADVDSLTEIIANEVIAAKGPEIPQPQGEGMDIDGEGPQATYNRLSDEREERGKMVEERRGREVDESRTAMGVVWVMYMRFARRAEGIKAARAVFGKARKSVHVTWHIFEASALMEYHVNKDSGVAIRIFELGFKLFSEDVDYVVRYLQFLLNVNDDTNARALFERSALKIPAEKSRSLWDTWAKYEYMYGDLGAVQKLEHRFEETFPADSPLKRFAQRYTYNGIDQIARRDLGFGGIPRPQPPPQQPQPQPLPQLQPQMQSQPHPPFPPTQQIQPPQLLPPVQALPERVAHNLPPPPLQGGSPAHKRPHPQSPPRPRRSIERSHSPSRGGPGGPGADFANKRYRPNSPPPPPRRYDQGPPPPREPPRRYGPGPAQGGGRSPLPMSMGSGGPPYPPLGSGGYSGPGPQGRHPSGNGLPPIPGPAPMGPPGYPLPPRDGWDRSGVSRGLAWFVGSLPNARSFDGPVFRADDIMGLFSNIGPDGMRLSGSGPGPGPGPAVGGYGGPPGGGQGGYGAEPPRGYGGGPPPRRY